MGWRTVFIDDASRLSLSLDNLIVKHQLQKYSIALNEIDTIILTDYKCVITAQLLAKCCEEGINFIFTKQNKMPIGALHSLQNNTRSSKVIKNQLYMTKKDRHYIWQQIITIKLQNQTYTLKKHNKEFKIIEQYSQEVELGDLSNKEGQAARVYFKKLFGYYFTREEEDINNYSLNYTYQVIRSRIAQVLLGKGLNPTLGVFHRNEYNYFNLADDMIEVFRPIIDDYVIQVLKDYNLDYLTPKLKLKLVEIVNVKVRINDKVQKLSNGIDVYISDILKIINKQKKEIEMVPRLYEE